MCWSGEASAAIAVGGFTSAYLLKRKGEPKEIYLTPAYFVLMEALQAVTYIVVDECDNSYNVLLTQLGILHISFQPFFINMLAMEFVDPKVKERIKNYIYVICGVAALLCVMRLLPMWDMLGRCQLGTPMCSHIQTCAYRGEWHIGWEVLLNGFDEGWKWYWFTIFLIPVVYGSWKLSLYHYVVGPFLASLTTTDDVGEAPAVWCLFSSCIIALLLNSRLRDYIYVKSWFTWKYLRKPEEKGYAQPDASPRRHESSSD